MIFIQLKKDKYSIIYKLQNENIIKQEDTYYENSLILLEGIYIDNKKIKISNYNPHSIIKKKIISPNLPTLNKTNK